jgi:hypothetical protein
MIPDVYDFHIPASHNALFVIHSNEFNDILCRRLSQDFGVDVYVYIPPIDEDLPHQEGTFTLYYKQGTVNIERCKAIILDYLASKQV